MGRAFDVTTHYAEFSEPIDDAAAEELRAYFSQANVIRKQADSQ